MAQKAGDFDEALWRGFLAGHFGYPSVDRRKQRQVESAGRFLCCFGRQPVWTWNSVSSDPLTLKNWLCQHKANLAELQFGNHRKYESKQPDGLYAVIESFVGWVNDRGGTPLQAFKVDGNSDPESNFDTLFQAMQGIWHFGRTGRFDLLCLLSEIDLLPVKPGSCYLDGSTMPLYGAKQLFGDHPAAILTKLANHTARLLGVPIEVFEDALCNWKKRKQP